jgi:cell wall-associated NlpC family hydrolase
MPARQPERTNSKPRPDHRRGMAVVALAMGVMFAYARSERATMYVIPGFSLGLAPFALPDEGTPATDAAASVMTTLEQMESRVVATQFRHETEVNEALGLYDFDASGLVGWVLARAAPIAFGALGRDRPVAEDFAHVIHDASAEEDTDGWRRLSHPSALRPGDVIAWSTPQAHRHDGLTGHTAIVVGMPARVPGMDEAWSVRVADSTNEFHQWDSRLLAFDLDGGVGRGTLTLAVGDEGRAYAYGWQGPWSPMFLRTDVEMGRVTR